MSSELIEADLEEYVVAEKPFGVFEIVATSNDSQKAIDTANTVMDKTSNVISAAYDDADNYQITVLERASEATPTIVTKNRIISTAIIVAGAFVLALVAVFVKFDYIAEK
jgi:capsular polysaccharide biosynthesis protein